MMVFNHVYRRKLMLRRLIASGILIMLLALDMSYTPIATSIAYDKRPLKCRDCK